MKVSRTSHSVPSQLITISLIVAGLSVATYLVQQKADLTPSARQPALPSCLSRPQCLDEKPPCQLLEPAEGWCPPIQPPKD